jgi:hypothetical protein
MQIVRKHWAFQTGYDVGTDLLYGCQVHFRRRPRRNPRDPVYRVSLYAQWDWPTLVWRSVTWAINEPGALRGMPVPRQGRWPRVWGALTGCEYYLAGVSWDRCFTVVVNP